MSSQDRASEAAVFFDGSRLTIARHLARLRKSDLAARIGKSPTAVAAWETGTKRPTATTVTQLALGLGVDPGFFAARANDLTQLGVTPHFRSLRSTSQLDRDQAFAYGRVAVDIATAIETHVEFPQVVVPVYPVDLDDQASDAPEQAARELRKAWGIPAGPVRHLVRSAENHGVLVVFSPTQTATVDAFSFDSHLRPVVVLNSIKRDYYRQRFDAAHELGHLVMHGDAEPGGRVVEDQAHRFASEFLMPADEIIGLLPTAMNGSAWVAFAKLKEQWGVSIQALLFRARRLGCLGEVSYRNAMTTLSSRGWRRNEPGLVSAIEQPSLLPRAVEILADECITQADLVEQCRVPVELFETVVARTPRESASTTTDGDSTGPRRAVTSLVPTPPSAAPNKVKVASQDTREGSRP